MFFKNMLIVSLVVFSALMVGCGSSPSVNIRDYEELDLKLFECEELAEKQHNQIIEMESELAEMASDINSLTLYIDDLSSYYGFYDESHLLVDSNYWDYLRFY